MSRLSITVLLLCQGLLWWRVEHVAGELKTIDRNQSGVTEESLREVLGTADRQSKIKERAEAALEHAYSNERKLAQLDATDDDLKKQIASLKLKADDLESDIDRDIMPDLRKWSAYVKKCEEMDRDLQVKDSSYHMNRLMGIKKLPWE